MDVGISFSIFGKQTISMGGQTVRPREHHFARLRECGFDHAEMNLMEGYLSPGDWCAADEARDWAQKHRIKINSVHGPSGWPTNGLWLADPDEQIRHRAIRERCLALETAARLGADYMVVEFELYTAWPCWPHGGSPAMRFPDAMRYWRQSLSELLDAAARTGVRLALENIVGVPSEDLAMILQDLDRSVAGVVFDSSHASFDNRLLENLDLLQPYIIGTHLSDNDALSGEHYVDRHWVPFRGAVDWPLVVSRIAEHSPCDRLTLEILDKENIDITDPLIAAAARLRQLATTVEA